MEEEQISLEKVPELIAGRKIFLCLFGSALKLEGVEEFLNLLKKTHETARLPETIWCTGIHNHAG